MSKIVIIVLLSYAVAIVAAFVADASWAIYLYQINYFLHPTKRWWFKDLPQLGTSFSYLISATCVATFILRSKKYKVNRILSLPQTKWLAGMLVGMIIISFYAVWPAAHYKALIDLIKLLLIIAITYKVIDSPEKFGKLLWAFLVGNFYVAWVAWDTGRTGASRLEAIGTVDAFNANTIAAVLISSVPILLYYLMRGKNLQRAASIVILAFVLNAVILINSRGAFIGLMAGAAYLAYFVFRGKMQEKNQKFIMLSIFSLGVCLFFYLTDALFWERMYTLTQIKPGQGGAQRMIYWLKAIDLVKSYPFGTGVWGYKFLSPQFLPAEMLSEGMRAAHSTPFEALTDFGYLGVPMLAGIVLSNFLFMKRVRNFLAEKGEGALYYQAVALEAALAAFLTSSLFIDRLYAETLYWLMCFLACFGNIYMQKYSTTEAGTSPTGGGGI